MTSIKNGCIKFKIAESPTEQQIQELTDAINAIYIDEEGAVWPDDGSYWRISEEELGSLIQNQELVIGLDEDSDQIVCSLRLHLVDDNWHFGILVTVPKFRGNGYASQLIDFSESFVKERGYSEMHIELLMSDELDLPRKKSLQNWYEQKGYVKTGTIDFKKIDPKKIPLMKGHCYFLTMKKDL